YATTFPCHECARHIVAAGIRKVVYIEPYPKSLVPELYPDSIVLERAESGHGLVLFRPFVGIAPLKYLQLFQAPKRKLDDGSVIVWNKTQAIPRFSEAPVAIRVQENIEVERFQRIMRDKKMFEAPQPSSQPTTAGGANVPESSHEELTRATV